MPRQQPCTAHHEHARAHPRLKPLRAVVHPPRVAEVVAGSARARREEREHVIASKPVEQAADAEPPQRLGFDLPRTLARHAQHRADGLERRAGRVRLDEGARGGVLAPRTLLGRSLACASVAASRSRYVHVLTPTLGARRIAAVHVVRGQLQRLH